MALLELTKREAKKKIAKGKGKKDKAIDSDKAKKEELSIPKKQAKKGIISEVKKIFKKERHD